MAEVYKRFDQLFGRNNFRPSSKPLHFPSASRAGMWGGSGIAPLILNLCTRWRWMVSFTPWPSYSREITTGVKSNQRGRDFLTFHCLYNIVVRSRDSAVRTRLGYGLNDPGFKSYRDNRFISYTGVNGRGRETGHSPPSRVEVQNLWSWISTSS